MWGGRFTEETNALAAAFNASVNVDQRLALQDIRGSIAHATMLGERGIVPADEVAQIIRGLEELRDEVRAGTFSWSTELEDVHMNLEHALTERVGPVGGKLHTARSRNDQVATDFRLWLREETNVLIDLLQALRRTLVEIAEGHLSVIMPGYTHLQVAQPVLFSHHLMAYYEMFSRDQSRLEDSLKRLNVSPLGAGALAGTGFPIDRERTAELLGFDRPAANSLDAVSDRDFALEFGFITLPDSHTTGSSIMPQKKNPDVSELMRGQTGRVYGNLIALLTVMKGLPLAYNKDMQEDKEGVFDSADTLQLAIRLTLSLLPEMQVNAERTHHAAGRAYSNATDLADYLAKRGLPFREAHEAVGKLVALGLDRGKDLQELSLEEMRGVSEQIEEDVFEVLRLENVVNARDSYGGTARAQVEQQIEQAKEMLG